MTRKDKEVVELRLSVPENLKNQFKGLCAMQGLTMSQVIAKVMQDYIDQQHNQQ
ncbi:MAG: ribbon-helix-helix domain-containing protein [Trichormus sp.]